MIKRLSRQGGVTLGSMYCVFPLNYHLQESINCCYVCSEM